MGAQDVYLHFIEPMKTIFGDPPGDRPEEAIMVYVRPLSRHAPETLRRTAQHFQETARRRTWPMPADVIEVANKTEVAIRYAAQQRAKESIPDPQEAERRAWQLIQSPIGIAAADDHWIGALFDFCQKHGRLPGDEEAVHVRRLGIEATRRMEADVQARSVTAAFSKARLEKNLERGRVARGEQPAPHWALTDGAAGSGVRA